MIGLYKDQIRQIVSEKINADPELRFYLEDEYVNEVIDKLIEGIVEAMDINNKKIETEMRKWINSVSRR